jgi:hypothetical protein
VPFGFVTPTSQGANPGASGVILAQAL